MLGPSTALYRSCLTHCTLTYTVVMTIWRDFSKPPQRRQGPVRFPLWLLVRTPFVIGVELASRRAEYRLLGCLYIFCDLPNDNPLLIRLCTEFWVVSIEHLRRVWHADRGRLLLRTPGPVPLGLAYVLLDVTYPFPNLSLFYRTMLFEYPSVLSRFCLIYCFYHLTTCVKILITSPI